MIFDELRDPNFVRLALRSAQALAGVYSADLKLGALRCMGRLLVF
jgi:hypothetical protein